MSFTRRQAQALLDWGRNDPRVMAVYQDPMHPESKLVRSYAERLSAIVAAPGPRPADEAPFDAETFMLRFANGDAAARSRLESVVGGTAAPAPLDKPLPDDDGLAELRSLTPEQARAKLDEVTHNADFSALLSARDKFAQAGYDFLVERAAAAIGGATSQDVAGKGTAAPAITPPAANSVADRLSAFADTNHPAHNPGHPDHATARAEFNAAFDAAIKEGTEQ